MQNSCFVIVRAATCIKARLFFTKDSFPSDFERDSFSSALLPDSTYVTLENDKGFLDFDMPFRLDLSSDFRVQSPLESDEFTTAGNPDTLAFTCGSEK